MIDKRRIRVFMKIPNRDHEIQNVPFSFVVSAFTILRDKITSSGICRQMLI